jgi:ATP adenylyltransferase
MRYVSGIEDFRKEGCIFCDKPKEGDDAPAYIVHRGESCFAMLNAFPYNTGHLMIAPYRHVGNLEELTPEEYCEMMTTAVLATRAIKEEMHSQGMNLGINLGKAAGAGIADHLHMHLVPRWDGDTNFMPVVADTKVMPETLDQTYARIEAAIRKALA